MSTRAPNPTKSLGALSLGAKFMFRTAEILGSDHRSTFPPYEGKVLTVIGFNVRNKNDVVVRDDNGNQSLMPLRMAEKALHLDSLRVPSP